MSRPIPAWLRWLGVPFSAPGLAAALIGAAAIPAFLVATSALWETAAGDDVTRRLVAERTNDEMGVVLSVDALFNAEELEAADRAVSDALAKVPELSEATRTLTTPRALAMLDDGTFGPAPVRMFAAAGAVDALRVVEAADAAAGGVWVSQWLADRTGLRPGDTFFYNAPLEPEEPGAEVTPVGGEVGVFRVAGIYETLWSEDGTRSVEPFWQDTPAGTVPVFIRPFDQPEFSLMVTDEATLASSGQSGIVRWSAPSKAPLSTSSELATLAARLDGFTRSLTLDSTLADALAALTPLATRPTVETMVPAVMSESAQARRSLAQPLGSVRIAGVVVGLAAMAGAGLLLVERRRKEFELLAGDGERWLRLGSRTAAQLLMPAVIGLAVGVTAAVAVAGAAFGDVDDRGLSLLRLAVASGAGLVVAAVASGLAGQASLDDGKLGTRRRWWPALAVAGGAGAYLWVVVGRVAPTSAGAVDLAVASLPLVALVAAVTLVIGALDVVARWSRSRPLPRLSPVGLLAWRRITDGRIGSRLVLGSVGVGIGMVVFSWVLVATLERSIDVKAAVVVGADTSIELLSHPMPGTELPDGATVIAVQRTRTTPGNGNVTIVAIDPETFAGAVDWPDELGGSPSQLISLIDAERDDGTLPAAAIIGQRAPDRGGFGTFDSFPYQVVARFHSLPLASGAGPTLVISADRLDALDLGRRAPGLDIAPDDPALPASFVAASRRFRPHLVSHLRPAELEPFLAGNELVARTTVTRGDLAGSVTSVGVRFAFDYLRLLGVVGGLTAVSGLLLYLSARRRERALVSVMTQRMGLSRRRHSVASTIEVGLLAIVAAAAAVATAPLVTARLIPRFDPAPTVPPGLGVVIPLGAVAALGLAVAIVVLGVWASERFGGPDEPGEVLRELG